MNINKERDFVTYLKIANVLFALTAIIIAAFLPSFIKYVFDIGIGSEYEAFWWFRWRGDISLYYWVILQYILYIPFTILAHCLHVRSDRESRMYRATSKQWRKWVLTFVFVPIILIFLFICSMGLRFWGVNLDYYDFGDELPADRHVVSLFYYLSVITCLLIFLRCTGRKSTMAKISSLFPSKSKILLGYRLYRYGSIIYLVFCPLIVHFVNSRLRRTSYSCGGETDPISPFFSTTYLLPSSVVLFIVFAVSIVGLIMFSYGMRNKKNLKYILKSSIG